MREFLNPNNISNTIATRRVRSLDPFATVQDREGLPKPDGIGIWHFIQVESVLSNQELEDLFSQPETAEEQAYLTDYLTERQQLKDEYLATIAQLQQIENATNPTNAQVIAAVKFLAKTIRLMLKLLARILT